MFWKKQREIEQLVLEHLRLVDVTLASFKTCFFSYVENGDIEQAEPFALETHRAEGKADDARRRIEKQMLAGSLLPASRRDILQIIDQVDRLANAAEEIVDYMLLQRIRIPEGLEGDLREIVVLSDQAFDESKGAVESLFRDAGRAIQHTQEIERLEGAVDHVERRSLKALFKMDIDLAWKLQIAGFLQRLVRISDRAEDLSDLIELIVAARRA